MGANVSDLRPEEVLELQSISNFSAQQIRKLYKRFMRLDRSRSGAISKSDLTMIPEVSMNPLGFRIVAQFDTRKDDQINFRDFVSVLSNFSAIASSEQKIGFMFNIYDCNEDGLLDVDDMSEVIGLLVGDNFTRQEIKQMARDTIKRGDIDEDGVLNFEEFSKMINEESIDKKLSCIPNLSTFSVWETSRRRREKQANLESSGSCT
eukprot:TRINITY_DN780132_c0_g1_i1.p1 TRINITY_DN780132_c0_g1~~TRINITY_DN780132_c0_g1_i1.p1  ORF type:complete len:206 (-),score=25.10 TRINITY_DN780132_c0_g1_i1:240-857(-)